ncbi:hypothetical protein [Nocardiopsis codii]|uniref:hypothetical protein n=1 Tax=Nocardiopsis codii TaxID=3065942 RepID=UPI002E7C48ED|nr:hypothetical protein [Nocardiopsis sp. CT-R113]
MSEPYEVDSDMGDDPQESEIAEAESRMDAGDEVRDYSFEDDDSRGEIGIDEEVREERPSRLPTEDWQPDEPPAEDEALSEVDEDGRRLP